jgi:hypothetical protein
MRRWGFSLKVVTTLVYKIDTYPEIVSGIRALTVYPDLVVPNTLAAVSESFEAR